MHDVTIRTPASREAIDEYRELVREYARAAVFAVDWPKLERDLTDLPRGFEAPDGAYLLARLGERAVGCVALRRFDDGQAEMKRLYVRPEARSMGLGARLAVAIADEARRLGYAAVLLDTYDRTPEAIRLYVRLGYVEIPAYCHNPEPDTRFFRLQL